jgi:hypothetical protein
MAVARVFIDFSGVDPGRMIRGHRRQQPMILKVEARKAWRPA